MNKIEIFEGDRAAQYDNFVDTWIPNYRFFMSMVPKLLKHVKDKNLLVAGCGTGNEILAFGDELPKWHITGVDPSIEMLQQAKKNLNCFPNIQLINSSVDELPKGTNFGAATLLLVLHFLEDDGNKLTLLKEISNRIKSDAPFILLDITGDKKQLKENLGILRKLILGAVDKEQIDMRINRIFNELHSISEKRLSDLLIRAGFKKPTRFYQSTIYMGWITRKK